MEPLTKPPDLWTTPGTPNNRLPKAHPNLVQGQQDCENFSSRLFLVPPILEGAPEFFQVCLHGLGAELVFSQ